MELLLLTRSERVALLCTATAALYVSPLAQSAERWQFLLLYDDRVNFVSNPILQGDFLLSWQNLVRMATTRKINVYEPLSWLLKALTVQCVGMDSRAIRIVTAVLHFAAGLVLVLVRVSMVLIEINNLLSTQSLCQPDKSSEDACGDTQAAHPGIEIKQERDQRQGEHHHSDNQGGALSDARALLAQATTPPAVGKERYDHSRLELNLEIFETWAATFRAEHGDREPTALETETIHGHHAPFPPFGSLANPPPKKQKRRSPFTPPPAFPYNPFVSSTMATEMKILLSAKEHLLVGLTLLLVPLLAIEFYGIATMRASHPEFAADSRMPQFVDLLTALAFSGVIVAARYVLTRALKPLARIVLEPKKRDNEDRVERFTTVLFKLIYFVGITYAGYYTMGHEEWFPKSLGGHGDMKKAYYLFSEPPSAGLKRYFMVQLGYHFHSLVYMVALSPIRNDFIEMLLHHVVTIILIGSAFMGNYTPSGALVALTHDIGDITGYAIKSVVDTGSTFLTLVMYAALLVSWAYTRLYVFPTELIYNAVFVLPNLTPEIPLLMLHPVNLMLTMLLVLHVYWYFLFLVMGYNLITKGVKEDIQQKCDDDGSEEKARQQAAAAIDTASKAKHD